MWWPSAARGAVLAVGLVAAGGPAGAQTIRGTVFDSSTGKPMRAAVELLDGNGKIVVQALSGDNGRYVLSAITSDSFVVRVRRIGYNSQQSQRVYLASGSDAKLDIRLQARPVPLAGVSVSATRGSEFLHGVGYFRRKQQTTGTFLDPDKVDQLSTKAKQTADLLDGIPGVTIRSYRGSAGLRVPVLTRQMGCSGTGADPEDAGPTTWPRIYLDGMLMNGGYQTFDVNTVPSHEILAIEVYDSVSEVPLDYGGTDSTCGVLVIWTKR